MSLPFSSTEPAILLKNLLFSNWNTNTPPVDSVQETFRSGYVAFTSRYYTTGPQRIHNYQISCRSGPIKKTPIEVGSLVSYYCEEQIEIHVWAIAGIGDDWETVENNLRNMLNQVDYIVRTSAVTQPGIQFIRITPGTTPKDEVVHRLVLHRIVTVTAIYYRTEGIPLLAFDFTIGILPTTNTVTQGSSSSPIVTLTLTSGSTVSTSFSSSISPSEPTIGIAFSPTSLSPTGTSTMTVTTTASTPVGNYVITVTGTGGSVSHSTAYTLAVTTVFAALLADIGAADLNVAG